MKVSYLIRFYDTPGAIPVGVAVREHDGIPVAEVPLPARPVDLGDVVTRLSHEWQRRNPQARVKKPLHLRKA